MTGPTASDKGMLRPQEAARHIDLRRYPVGGPLGTYVERYWSVHWDLPEGASYESVVIPHPCVNLSFMPGLGPEVHGPGMAVSRHPLTGAGRVFGAKFRPGGFTAFTGIDAAAFADWVAGAATVFGSPVEELNAVVMGGGDEAVAAAVTRFLSARMPERVDERYEELLRIVAAMLEDRGITRVDQVTARFFTTPKRLQRLFQAYIGLGPKTLLSRYRLHDAADRLAADAEVDLAGLAAELGWSDQAHFTHDFKNVIGYPPSEYAVQCASAARELVIARR
ncbi:helix-turn-helix domain-containing protein [Glycomyces sp. NRRL B-16210]|uniref:AraC family transcriptional regulator n=1 Tax=Glycomyces sp. NRRL B-16210 TaxID=1463821 RepID=UPI0004C10AEF|nr:helix-turn-helix domain-containing protein [Glycomyces sp. NRRL B-16210]